MIIKEHTINDIKILEYENTNIFIIEDILDDLLCDELIRLINISDLEKTDYFNGNNVRGYITSFEEILKKNDELYYVFSTDPQKYSELLANTKTNNIYNIMYDDKININEIQKKIDDKITNLLVVMRSINQRIDVDVYNNIILRKIYGKTREHTDGTKEIIESNICFLKKNRSKDFHFVRNLTFIFSLNDDYDGGELLFPSYDISIKLKKGSVVIFPPFWTHPHSTNDLLNNTFRYTITTWGCIKI